MENDISDIESRPIVVVGGGVAGSSSVQVLASRLTNRSIWLINPGRWLKVTTNVRRLGLALEQFDVTRVAGEQHVQQWPNVRLISASVVRHDAERRLVTLNSGAQIEYERLVLTTGARPKQLHHHCKSMRSMDEQCKSFVITLRDEQSVMHLQRRLATCRTVMILGNGGIATELAHSIRNCHIIWVVKDATINSTFLDSIGSTFLERRIALTRSDLNESDDKATSDSKWRCMSDEQLTIDRIDSEIGGDFI
jgi:NADH dehydrogenase FAD-containing subunit